MGGDGSGAGAGPGDPSGVNYGGPGTNYGGSNNYGGVNYGGIGQSAENPHAMAEAMAQQSLESPGLVGAQTAEGLTGMNFGSQNMSFGNEPTSPGFSSMGSDPATGLMGYLGKAMNLVSMASQVGVAPAMLGPLGVFGSLIGAVAAMANASQAAGNPPGNASEAGPGIGGMAMPYSGFPQEEMKREEQGKPQAPAQPPMMSSQPFGWYSPNYYGMKRVNLPWQSWPSAGKATGNYGGMKRV